MKIFEMHDYNLQISEEAWGLSPFKTILKRDKNRNKELAFKEMLFVFLMLNVLIGTILGWLMGMEYLLNKYMS